MAGNIAAKGAERVAKVKDQMQKDEGENAKRFTGFKNMAESMVWIHKDTQKIHKDTQKIHKDTQNENICNFCNKSFNSRTPKETNYFPLIV